MAATYTAADLATSAKDRVRFLIGDTTNLSNAATCLDDAEITYTLSAYASEAVAALECARALAAKLSPLCDIEVGDYKEDLSQRVAALRVRVDELREAVATGAAVGSAVLSSVGGISASENRSDRNDTDRETPNFLQRQFDDSRDVIAGSQARNISGSFD